MFCSIFISVIVDGCLYLVGLFGCSSYFVFIYVIVFLVLILIYLKENEEIYVLSLIFDDV